MGEPHVISGLKNKRTRIAGEIAAAQRAINQRRTELAQLDAVIRMFTPDRNPDMIPPIRPGSHRLFFSCCELPRMLLRIMRSAVRRDVLSGYFGRFGEGGGAAGFVKYTSY